MSHPAELAPTRTRVRIGVGAATVLFLVGAAAAVLFSAMAPTGHSTEVGNDADSYVGNNSGNEEDSEKSSEPGEGLGDDGNSIAGPQSSATIFIHILGAVEKSGLYELRDGSRAVDAVAAAGGFTATADQSQLNLARFVTDGEQIIVPEIGASPPHAGGGSGNGLTGGGAAVPGKVNINTADATILETLPRIGPSMSARIISWRDINGRFTTIDDLLSVTGIGEKTFDGLKDLVTV
jgi:competence protein ComEA